MKKQDIFLQIESQREKVLSAKEISKDVDVLDHLEFIKKGQVATIIVSGNPTTGEYEVEQYEKIAPDMFIFLGKESRS